MYPNSEKNRMMGAQLYNSGPLTGQPAQAPQAVMPEKGMGAQLGEMAKQKAMSTALDAGATELTGALGSSALGGTGMGAAAMTAMPYVGAGLMAGKALGLFNEGGQVGPLSAQYHADGNKVYSIPNPMVSEAELLKLYDHYQDGFFAPGHSAKSYEDFKKDHGMRFSQGGPVGMTEADAIALMNNQPSPDQLYDEIMTEAAIKQMPQPMMRPPLGIDPFGADRTHSPYDMIRPDNAPST